MARLWPLAHGGLVLGLLGQLVFSTWIIEIGSNDDSLWVRAYFMGDSICKRDIVRCRGNLIDLY